LMKQDDFATVEEEYDADPDEEKFSEKKKW
jgi:hypothetical protein